eukprot:scaffold14843_cov193-Alexandrium_tamarense.AAC.1
MFAEPFFSYELCFDTMHAPYYDLEFTEKRPCHLKIVVGIIWIVSTQRQHQYIVPRSAVATFCT